ncbi:MAG: hypothetical protein NTW96_07760 [Planctomycetia bacterium]|nr:hypothetical protein [Planctomycetia bacterium]
MILNDLTDRPAAASLRDAAIAFLRQTLPAVSKVNVTKLVPIDEGEGVWEAEAEVWQPNATIESLGIQTRRPVLDKVIYLVRLDRHLYVSAYGLKDSVSSPE